MNAINDRRLRLALAVLAATLAPLSCSDGVAAPSEIASGLWKLQSMEPARGPRFEPDDPDRFTLEFLTEDRLAVVADCNLCGGRYTLEGETLTVTELVCTLRLCPRPQGQRFAELIEGTATVAGDGSERLELESPEGTLVLTR